MFRNSITGLPFAPIPDGDGATGGQQSGQSGQNGQPGQQSNGGAQGAPQSGQQGQQGSPQNGQGGQGGSNGQNGATGAPAGQQGSQSQGDGYTAPWDRNGETFDADRARRLLEARDRDMAALRQRADELQRAEDERQRAAMTEQQRLEADLQRQRDEAAQAARERDAYRVAMTHGLGPDDMDLLGTGTPDELDKRGKRLAELKAAAAAPPAGTTAPPAGRRPNERLTPGASPTDSATAEDAYPESWRPAHLRRPAAGA